MARWQLLELGLDDHAIRHRVRIGHLSREYPGVYSVGRPAVTPHERASAAVMACGHGAVLSHGSAMTLHGLWKRWDLPFEVTVAVDRRPKGIRVHRSRRLYRRDVGRQHGIPVTKPARTLLDVAPRLRPSTLRRAVKDAQTRKLASLEALSDAVRRHPHHPGARMLRPFLGDSGDTRSELEDRFLAFCQSHGLLPQTNATVCGLLVDALFEAERVIVELDGWDFHSSRESFEDDRERDGVTTAAGLVTVRITSRRFRVQTERLLTILAARGD